MINLIWAAMILVGIITALLTGQDNGGRMFRAIGCTIGNDIYRDQLQRRNIQNQEDAHLTAGRFASLVVLSQLLHRL